MSGAESKLNNKDYIELSRLIKSKGLLNKQPGYYVCRTLLTLGMLIVSIALIATVDTLWIQLINAAFLAFVFTHIGFIAHDGGHQQIVTSARKIDFILLSVNFLIALNRSWWVEQHQNRHHSNPNEPDIDPDANVPLLALTPEQALGKEGVSRFLVKHQAYLFFPMLCLKGVSLRLAGIQHLLLKKAKYPLIESTVLIAHVVLYTSLLFYFLNPLHAVLFMVVHQSLLGLYMGGVFAPNHKGMPILGQGHKMNYLRQQVETARNIRPNPLVDYLYGGLNYQIEHHLFPAMPSNKMGEAQKIVRAFCQERSVSYHETGIVGAYWEILKHLHVISRPLRLGNVQAIPAQNVLDKGSTR